MGLSLHGGMVVTKVKPGCEGRLHGMIAGMKDVVTSMEERLAAAPFAGTLTSEELAGVDEAEADFAHGFFTVDSATIDAAAVSQEPAPKSSSASR